MNKPPEPFQQPSVALSSFPTQAEAAPQERTPRLTEPMGMEDVPDTASQSYRDRYASVMRDFHSGRPIGATKRVATGLTEAKAVAAKFASEKPPARLT